MLEQPACNSCFQKQTHLGKYQDALKLREIAVEKREAAVAAAEMTNVKKREREIQQLDKQMTQWQQAEKKKRLNLERDVMDRLQKEGYYISEGSKKVIATQAGLAEEITARDAVMETQAEEADTLREKGLKAYQEKLEYQKKLREEKEKAGNLLRHAASLESALKQKHRQGARVGRLAENEVAKARRAAASLICLKTASARDKAALAKFRRARKTALEHERRQAKRELEEKSIRYSPCLYY